MQRAYNHICAQGYKNVTLKFCDNCRHEVFNEKDKEIYLQDVLDWLKKVKIAEIKTLCKFLKDLKTNISQNTCK